MRKKHFPYYLVLHRIKLEKYIDKIIAEIEKVEKDEKKFGELRELLDLFIQELAMLGIDLESLNYGFDISNRLYHKWHIEDNEIDTRLLKLELSNSNKLRGRKGELNK
jgi:hypothetical protein